MTPKPPAAPRTPKGRAPHRRDENARLAVLHAADDLLVERGFKGVTIEGIAARAGVAKQTIYRWWPSKAHVLLDTLIEDTNRALTIPTTGSVLEAVRGYLHSLADFLNDDPAGRVLLALVGEAQHDAEMARLFHERYHSPRREAERELLRRGVEAGELAAGLDVDATLDALCGPVVYRALMGTDVAPAFVDRLVTDALESDRG